MITLLIPSCGGDIRNFVRTRNSALGVCNQTVAISTCLFDEDVESLRREADAVVELPWNHVFTHGFGEMHNQGHGVSSNDWIILLGVAETIHMGHGIITDKIKQAHPKQKFECWHVGDTNRWTRLYNKTECRWSGGIHEAIVGGMDGGCIFEMRDTEKTVDDEAKSHCLKVLKGILYNWRYKVLLDNPGTLGGTDHGWLGFVKGAAEAIDSYCVKHQNLLNYALSGDRDSFIKEAMKTAPEGVNFNKLGTITSGNETIQLA